MMALWNGRPIRKLFNALTHFIVAMIVNDGVVQWVGREAPGKFDVSSAESVLAQL
jgi:peroxiredoxin